jgi:solute:Na+ symporter, SSS family
MPPITAIATTATNTIELTPVLIMGAVYFVVMLSIGFWKPKPAPDKTINTTASFYTNAGFLGTVGLALSFAAAWFGATSTKAIMDKYTTQGLSAIWFIAMPSMLTMALVSGFIGRRVQQLPYLTMPEAVEAHYGKVGRCILAVVILVTSTTTLASQLVASVQVLQGMVGPELALPILTTVYSGVVFYSMFGGFFAVALTDTFQCMLMFISISSLFAFTAWQGFTHWGETYSTLSAQPASFWNILPEPAPALAMTAVFALSWAIAPEMWQRMKACTTPQQATRVAGLSFGMIALLCSLVLGISLLSLPMFVERLANANEPVNILLWLTALLPSGWWQGLVLLGFFSAVTSTMDSSMSVASQSFTYDLIKRFALPHAEWRTLRWFNYAMLPIQAVLSLWIALKTNDVIATLWLSADVMACILLVPIMAILFDAHPHKKAGITAMWVGGCCVALTTLQQLGGVAIPFWPASPFNTLLGICIATLVYVGLRLR